MSSLFNVRWRVGQWHAISRMLGSNAHALFADIGSGKTIMLLAEAIIAWQAGLIDGALIVSWNGVHRKWLTEQLPKLTSLPCTIYHTPDALPFTHKGRISFPSNKPVFLAVHREGMGMAGKTYRNLCKAFLKSGRMAFIWDESQDIRTPSSKRAKVSRWLGPMAAYRRIASGFPNPTGMLNFYNQYTFLDPEILGMRHVTAFKDRYVEFKAGFRGYKVISGYKNVEEFNRKVAPYTTHIEQDRRGRLDPLYVEKEVQLSREQRKHWDDLKQEFTTVLRSGQRLDVPLAVTRLIRLQQLTCGWLPIEDDDGNVRYESINEHRTAALLEALEECRGKVIIWSRFVQCIQRLEKRLGKRAMSIYGQVKPAERERRLDVFTGTDKVQWLIAQPETLGTGRNELVVASKAIFWSNDFKALNRKQAEGRIDRDGQPYRCTFIDLVCANSYDRKILDTLRSRRDIGDAMVRDIGGWQ